MINSCINKETKLQKYEEEVIAVHDEVMPVTMNVIPRLKNKLQASLAASKDTSTVYDFSKKLDEADEAMMVWMDKYKGIDNNLTFEENMSNLKNQMISITEVKKITDDVVMATENYLNKK